MRNEMLGLEVYPTGSFAFSYADLRDSNNIFIDTRDATLVFMEKFIQMDFHLPTRRIYGFGERTRKFNLGEGTWTMWSRNRIPGTYDDGSGGL